MLSRLEDVAEPATAVVVVNTASSLQLLSVGAWNFSDSSLMDMADVGETREEPETTTSIFPSLVRSAGVPVEYFLSSADQRSSADGAGFFGASSVNPESLLTALVERE